MRKILCIVLVFIICSFSIVTLVFAENEKDLTTKQQELQDKIKETNEELEGVQNSISQNLEQVQKLDEKIQNSQAILNELNIKIEALQTSINEVKEKLEIAEEKYNKQQKMLDERLLAIYESSDTQYLDVMLSSKSISDFLSNYFLITELTTYDTELLEDIKKQKEEIEIEKAKLENNQKQLATIKQNQTKTAKILENTKIIRENYISKLSEREKDLQSKIDEYNVEVEAVNKEILASILQGIDTKYIGGELAWPVPGYTRISSNYGMRYHPILHINKLHTGVDIAAPAGSNFIAANDGIVTKAGFNTAYGNMVIIDHGGGISTLYAHGSEILVQVGQTVKRGEAVLKVGSTGYSTGPHAHFEVRINGVVTDPMPYITNGIIPNANVQEKEEQIKEDKQQNNKKVENTQNSEENQNPENVNNTENYEGNDNKNENENAKKEN